MAEQKTRPSDASVGAFISAIADARRRADAETLVALMARVTGEPPTMWSSMVGFGHLHYRYATGTEGDTFLAGFAPRKAAFSIYLMGLYAPELIAERDVLLGRLGRHEMGKACLTVKRLADIDLDVLERLVRLSVDALKRQYPAA